MEDDNNTTNNDPTSDEFIRSKPFLCERDNNNIFSIVMKCVRQIIPARAFSNYIRPSLAQALPRVDEEPKPLSEKQKLAIKQSNLFTKEKERQRNAIGRIEKIEVQYKGLPEDVTLLMNKHLSTPFECSRHLSIKSQSALARVNGKLWDLHRPLNEDCELEFLHLKEADPFHANKAFWRSCSMMLGAVVNETFKDNVACELHSFPSPNVKSGSFVYDVQLDLEKWSPTKDELRKLSSQFMRLAMEEHPFEHLTVDAEVAEDIFFDSPHKLDQIPQIASQLSDDNKISLYRIGHHVDISRGPMVGSTGFVGRATITAAHKLNTSIKNLYRFQGVALPKGFTINHFAYGILEHRAANLNKNWIPGQQAQ